MIVATVLLPTVPKGRKSESDPRWAASDPYVVARGRGSEETHCPIFKDKVRYKSITTVVDLADEDDATYSLEYVLGGGAVSKRKVLPDGKVALRANYKAW